jgi:sulfur carrier protein
MNVSVNGDATTVDERASIASVVAQVAPSPKGIAVAVNGDIVPRSRWDHTGLRDGDAIEILGAAQGG